jgi:hypothetical protein
MGALRLTWRGHRNAPIAEGVGPGVLPPGWWVYCSTEVVLGGYQSSRNSGRGGGSTRSTPFGFERGAANTMTGG